MTNILILSIALATNWVTVSRESPVIGPGEENFLVLRYDTLHQVGTVVKQTVASFEFDDKTYNVVVKTESTDIPQQKREIFHNININPEDYRWSKATRLIEGWTDAKVVLTNQSFASLTMVTNLVGLWSSNVTNFFDPDLKGYELAPGVLQPFVSVYEQLQALEKLNPETNAPYKAKDGKLYRRK